MPDLFDGLLEVEALSRVDQYSLLSPENLVNLRKHLKLCLVRRQLDPLFIPDGRLPELFVEFSLLLFEVLDEVKPRRDALTILLAMLGLVHRKLSEDGFLDCLLIGCDLSQLLFIVRVLHFVPSQTQDEVIGELLNPAKDVDLSVFLRLLLVHLEFLGHSAEQLDVVTVVQCTAHVLDRVQIALFDRLN